MFYINDEIDEFFSSVWAKEKAPYGPSPNAQNQHPFWMGLYFSRMAFGHREEGKKALRNFFEASSPDKRRDVRQALLEILNTPYIYGTSSAAEFYSFFSSLEDPSLQNLLKEYLRVLSRDSEKFRVFNQCRRDLETAEKALNTRTITKKDTYNIALRDLLFARPEHLPILSKSTSQEGLRDAFAEFLIQLGQHARGHTRVSNTWAKRLENINALCVFGTFQESLAESMSYTAETLKDNAWTGPEDIRKALAPHQKLYNMWCAILPPEPARPIIALYSNLALN